MAAKLHPIPTVLDAGHLKVGEVHSIYWETRGNPSGIPVVFLHGGPGSGFSESHFRFFDPEVYRLIAFDQRGAGRSRPSGELAENTTADLVADIERLRIAFGISRWCVFGGSWGSTLALAYAEAFPERASALVLRGVWLVRPKDIDWWLRHMGRIIPEEGDRFTGFVPEAERGDILAAYYRRLTSPDPAICMPAARVWKSYESNCTRLLYDAATRKDLPEDDATLAKAKIEAHYLVNRGFLGPDALLAGIAAIADVPTYAVHGRYDIVCPIDNALALAAAHPAMHLTISPASGHSALEDETAGSLVQIMDGLISTLNA